MDKNIPQFIVEKIENKAKKHGNQYESKYNAYVDFKRGAEFGYLLAQSENDNMVVEVLEWVLNNAKTTVTHTATILQERTATHENETIRFSQYEIDGEYFSPSELFTQFKKSKSSNV